MGLKADIDEVTQHWRRSPWRVKVFLLVALFLSTSSLASLSEAVFKWKGFLLDALAFYRRNMSQPVSELATHLLARPLSPHFIDSAVLFGLFHGALIRALLLRQVTLATRITGIASLTLSYSGMLYLMANAASPPNQPKDFSIWIVYPAFLLTAYILTKGAERLLAMSYMLVPVILVAMVAAVSSGLAK